MTADERPEDTTPDSSPDASSEGQVSEVVRMDPADADTPISDSQSLAGDPESQEPGVELGRVGPNAKTGSDDPEHRAIENGETLGGPDVP